MTALGFLASFCFALVSGFVAAFLGKALRRRVALDPVEIACRAILPGHECGLCGYAGCREYAKALVVEQADPARCLPGGSAVEGRLRSLLGGSRAESSIAVVKCSAGSSDARLLFSYSGPKNCRAALAIFGGDRACGSACLGLGSCLSSCAFGAISMTRGLAEIDTARCTGCGECLPSCPVGVIALIPRSLPWYVACNSRSSAAVKESYCKTPCTACGLCETRSEAWQFVVDRGLARFAAKSESALPSVPAIAANCPTNVIRCALPDSTSPASS